MTTLTREHVRSLLAQKNITVENVTIEQLQQLASLLQSSLAKSGNYRNTYTLDYPPKDLMYMTCSTDQWNGRECISFNCDGFIGFAGWADDRNTKPILEAVVEWAEKIAPDKSAPSQNLHKLALELLTLSGMVNQQQELLPLAEWPTDYDYSTLNAEVEKLVANHSDYNNFIHGDEVEVEEVIERLGIDDLDEFALEVVTNRPIMFVKPLAEVA